MRHYIIFFINGKKYKIDQEDSFKKLSDYLRYDLSLTGTKVVCSEGDCGACSVLYGKYIPSISNNGKGEIKYSVINSCIKYLYQLDKSHIITVEGLSKDGELNPIQETLANNHGTQCGFCTPGFAVTITDIFIKNQNNNNLDLKNPNKTFTFLKENLSGNLCRCTGYDPILQASYYLKENNTQMISSYAEIFNEEEILNEFQKLSNEVKIDLENYTYYQPTNIQNALSYIETEHPERIVSGGTDISVQIYKSKKQIHHLLSNHFLEDLSYIRQKNNTIYIGANTTISEFSDFLNTKNFAHDQFSREIIEYLKLFASPQIRNTATIAGNIANASPIGDLLPMLFALDAKVEVINLKESKLIPIQEFYTGYKQMQMNSNELIKGIEFDIPQQKILKLYKISKRRHLDIATFNAAFLLKIENNKLADVSIAYGGVAPVILKLVKTEKFLFNKNFTIDTFQKSQEIAEQEVAPISDVRANKNYRNLLSKNILIKLYYDLKNIFEST